MESLAARHLDDSRICLTQTILYPEVEQDSRFAQPGVLLRLADDAAFMATMRHSLGKRVITACVSNLVFHDNAHFHDLVCCQAEVTAVGNRTMLVEVYLEASPPPFLTFRQVMSGDFVYVLLEAAYMPLQAPRLLDRNTDEAMRINQAQQRLQAIKAASVEMP